MNIQRELQALVDSGLRFSIELDGREVIVRLGDYLRERGMATTVRSFEQAVEWLQEHRGMTLAR